MFDFLSVLKSGKVDRFLNNLASCKSQILFGLSSEIKGLLLGLGGKGGIFVAKDLVSSGRIAEQLNAFNLNVRFVTNTYENEMGLVDNLVFYDYISILSDFVNGKTDILITTVDALFQKAPSLKSLKEGILKLEVGKNFGLEKTIKQLVEMGYYRTEFVSRRGQFSLRGDVLQIFPINEQNLVRIEFFDDEIEKISLLNPEDKKFLGKKEDFSIIAINYPKTEQNLLALTDIVFFDEPKQLSDLAQQFLWAENFVEKSRVFETNAKSQTAFAGFSEETFFKSEDVLVFNKIPTKKYIFDFKELIKDLAFYCINKTAVYIFCQDKTKKERIDNFLSENFLFAGNAKQEMGKVITVTEFLPYSVAFADSDCVLIGTYDIFKKEKIKPKSKSRVFYTPKVGEFVVHETHGVGKCIGLEKLKFSDYEKDYFIIEYSGGDKFYLPIEQADTISAFYGGDKEPKLNKLGGVEFSKIKEKVYSNVKAIAFDLLQLYARREKSTGNVYNPDDYLMETFEDAFPFEETADQLQAINDIKTDMESPRIMDRLVCGDVGYGKTEVALRAIYKAVLSGKQVAFLCPTTILAEQHYKTCTKRFNGFMVKVARFNRLVSTREQTEVLEGLENGSINVVCGTHKLLSSKVKFKNLSLLVLDEEQRFGVEDKEKIKNIKTNVDVLALSATPIPRTLHMSLSGIRDISVIETPPKERIPVQTFVTDYSDDLLARASKQELARNGQVLIIFNRIENIYKFASRVQELLPNARIGVAHGRLPQRQLEDVIMKLYNHEYDILVSTTLIENGIDLPSANTLIVIDADFLGLSQLYQIRGRIGRSDKIAYAYFTYNSSKVLTENAYQRLNALMEFTELGSGFKIAMTDLEIRGAGNVLGKEQHGNMSKVGYDLYYKLLANALKEIKGEKTDERKEVKLDVTVSAFIPESYITNEQDRIKRYEQISGFASREEVIEFRNEILKIYGAIPSEMDSLLELALLKNLAVKNDAKRVVVTNREAKVVFYDKPEQEFAEQGLTIKQKISRIIDFFEKNCETLNQN